MRKRRVYPDSAVGKVQFFLLDYPDKMALECVCSRYGGRLVRLFVEGDWRQYPLLLNRDRVVSEFIKKAIKSAPPPGCGAPPDAFFAEQYPAVWDFLTLSVIDMDGLEMKRLTSTLSIFTQDGLWKCFLNDRDRQKCLCVAAITFTALLEALEAALTSDETPWRDMLQGGSTTRQKGRGKPTGQGG